MSKGIMDTLETALETILGNLRERIDSAGLKEYSLTGKLTAEGIDTVLRSGRRAVGVSISLLAAQHTAERGSLGEASAVMHTYNGGINTHREIIVASVEDSLLSLLRLVDGKLVEVKS